MATITALNTPPNENTAFSRTTHTFKKRWTTNPKIAFYGPPNVFFDEILTRMAIDFGIPLL